MATRSPKALVIPLDNFIYRIAWYVFTDKTNAAEALRQLAADCRPVYHVDEEAIYAELAYKGLKHEHIG
jgi:hypothetical protein